MQHIISWKELHECQTGDIFDLSDTCKVNVLLRDGKDVYLQIQQFHPEFPHMGPTDKCLLVELYEEGCSHGLVDHGGNQ